MHEITCTWCQAEQETPAQENRLGEQQASHYICEDCLIQLLPKSLSEDSEHQADASSESERRHSERFPVFSTVYLMEEHQYQPKEVKSIILDISQTGIRIAIPKRLEIDGVVQLGFYAKYMIYKARSRVVRVQPFDSSSDPWFDIGLQFISIQQEKR